MVSLKSIFKEEEITLTEIEEWEDYIENNFDKEYSKRKLIKSILKIVPFVASMEFPLNKTSFEAIMIISKKTTKNIPRKIFEESNGNFKREKLLELPGFKEMNNKREIQGLRSLEVEKMLANDKKLNVYKTVESDKKFREAIKDIKVSALDLNTIKQSIELPMRETLLRNYNSKMLETGTMFLIVGDNDDECAHYIGRVVSREEAYSIIPIHKNCICHYKKVK